MRFLSTCVLFLLSLDAASAVRRQLQTIETTATTETTATLGGCQGVELEMITQGCDTPEHCQEAAQSQGLQLGSEEWPFTGEWADKGCVFYPADHELYPNQAYFGLGGSCPQLKMQPMAGGERLSCNGRTRPPFDPLRCSGQGLCKTAENCQRTALANGYQLGNEQDSFEGDYHVKGCVFYPDDHPEYPGQSFWGTGASICGQIRADPSAYDGSMRMTCPDEEDEEDALPPADSRPQPPTRPVTNNATTSTQQNVTEEAPPVVVDEEDPIVEADPQVSTPIISEFGQEVSAATVVSSVQLGLMVLAALAIL